MISPLNPSLKNLLPGGSYSRLQPNAEFVRQVSDFFSQPSRDLEGGAVDARAVQELQKSYQALLGGQIDGRDFAEATWWQIMFTQMRTDDFLLGEPEPIYDWNAFEQAGPTSADSKLVFDFVHDENLTNPVSYRVPVNQRFFDKALNYPVSSFYRNPRYDGSVRLDGLRFVEVFDDVSFEAYKRPFWKPFPIRVTVMEDSELSIARCLARYEAPLGLGLFPLAVFQRHGNPDYMNYVFDHEMKGHRFTNRAQPSQCIESAGAAVLALFQGLEDYLNVNELFDFYGIELNAFYQLGREKSGRAEDSQAVLLERIGCVYAALRHATENRQDQRLLKQAEENWRSLKEQLASSFGDVESSLENSVSFHLSWFNKQKSFSHFI